MQRVGGEKGMETLAGRPSISLDRKSGMSDDRIPPKTRSVPESGQFVPESPRIASRPPERTGFRKVDPGIWRAPRGWPPLLPQDSRARFTLIAARPWPGSTHSTDFLFE